MIISLRNRKKKKQNQEKETSDFHITLLLGCLRRSKSNRVKKKKKHNKLYHASEWISSLRIKPPKLRYLRETKFAWLKVQIQKARNMCVH